MHFIQASKFHSYGNDFLIVAADQVAQNQYAAVSRAICDLHFGAGADGCVFVAPAPDRPAYSVRIFNQDGSEAGMSGNGVRCAAAWLHREGRATGAEIELQAVSGRKIYRLVERGNEAWKYESQMGEPRFDPPSIPFTPLQSVPQVRRFPLPVESETVEITALSVGNPQCVVLSSELPPDDRFLRLGAALEAHPWFPQRTNVSFVKVDGEHDVSARIYERGVGPTFSSGTGSCGAAVASLVNGLTRSPVNVRTATGVQQVAWQPGSEILLTGWAEFIARLEFCWRGDA